MLVLAAVQKPSSIKAVRLWRELEEVAAVASFRGHNGPKRGNPVGSWYIAAAGMC